MRTKKNEIIVKVILTAITLIMGLCCIYPFIFMISSSFKPSGDVLSTPLQIIPKTLPLLTSRPCSTTSSTISSSGSATRWS